MYFLVCKQYLTLNYFGLQWSEKPEIYSFYFVKYENDKLIPLLGGLMTIEEIGQLLGGN